MKPSETLHEPASTVRARLHRALTSLAARDSWARRSLAKLGIAFGFALFSFGLTGCFKVSSDAEALRNGVLKTAGTSWDKQIEIGVGALTLNLVRAGLAFVDLEPDARAAVKAIRSAEVGVYKLEPGSKRLNHPELLIAADKAMTTRGWDRVVAVVSERELVAIYVPKSCRSARNVRACLVTLNDREMVVASARSNLEPLIALGRALLATELARVRQ